MPSPIRLALFEACEDLRNFGAAGELCGQNKERAFFAWQYECDRLRNLPARLLRRVYDLQQHGRTDQVSAELKLSKMQAFRIAAIWHERLEAAKAARARLKELFRQYAPRNSWTGSVYKDASWYIEEALDRIADTSWHSNRYPGEFSRKELSRGKQRSDFGWIYRVLCKMPRDLAELCFESKGKEFLEACESTFGKREKRKSAYLTNGEAEIKQPRSHRKRLRYEYLPIPKIDPSVLASLITKYEHLENEVLAREVF